ncbi:hypothetical protein BJY16_004289 [Actinoplanes octamycinicus]|uniref:YbaB/EbfC DNA-binding family protein n=1 Tax=Actinoplanes octamycinicus TaxID=135948 RepID=A0A7W7GYV3_9ACTN|nr:hypothetical protein [Actinoplanes octamycinicus]MBB4740830.1 hypothetical protein [Actinoplanes octamycinicus]GIE55733.1 hypothetical protein Aoc01nite_11350 [Actinoplanes octamycinicus]
MTYDAADIHRLDALLDNVAQVMKKAAATGGNAETPTAEGTAADHLIRARVGPRRVESLTIDSRAMRMGSAELAEQIRYAINEAFEAISPSNADTAAAAREVSQDLAEQVNAIRDESARSMTMFLQAMQHVATRIDRDRDR